MKTPQPLPPPFANGPFTTRDALAAGVDPNQLRTKAVQQPFRGVNVVSTEQLTLRARCEALQTRMPRTARFSGITAARLLGVPLPSRLTQIAALHVAVPRGSPAPRGREIIGHRYLVADSDVSSWMDLRVSSPPRVFYELSGLLEVTALVAAGDFLVHHRQPLATIEALAAGAARFPRHRGRRTLATALALLDEHSESPRESHLRVILHQAQIATVANFSIRTTGGFDYRVDLAIPGRMIVIEYQSDEFHGDPAARRRDMTRRARLEADGWFVVELNADDLANPTELVSRFRKVIARRPLL